MLTGRKLTTGRFAAFKCISIVIETAWFSNHSQCFQQWRWDTDTQQNSLAQTWA